MALSSAPSAQNGDGDVVSSINTTPLVDVMLVLLIIFLITIPVVTQTVPVRLPTAAAQIDPVTPARIVIAVTQAGEVYWNLDRVTGSAALLDRLREAAQHQPPPHVELRGDAAARWEAIGRVVVLCRRAGLEHVAFISQPPSTGP